MSSSLTSATDQDHPYWLQNLAVCMIGSVTTVVAMTLLVPFLPLYVEQLGVSNRGSIAEWSGIAYGATFFSAALVAPLWGRLADLYGRKIMLIRASLCMALAISLMGMAQNVWELVLLRLFAGLTSGYASGSTILVASHTPQNRSGWALGMLSSSIMVGNLIGPLIGGALPPLIGIRETFLLSGIIVAFTFLGTVFFIKERRLPRKLKTGNSGDLSGVRDRRPIIAMLAVGPILLLANMSVEPVITLYVGDLGVRSTRISLLSGVAMSAAAVGSLLSASLLGWLADRVGHWKIIVGALAGSAILLIPQAFAKDVWQFVALRFAMGLSLGGLLPCVISVLRASVPDRLVGQTLGYLTSSQYFGQVLGPLLGGMVAAQLGVRSVFLMTSAIVALGACLVWFSRESIKPWTNSTSD